MQKENSLFSVFYDQINSFIDENRDFMIFIFLLSYRNKIDEVYRLGFYKSKCNYYIDKNWVNKEIKELRKKLS